MNDSLLLKLSNAFERNVKIDVTKTNIHFTILKWIIGSMLIVTIGVSLFCLTMFSMEMQTWNYLSTFLIVKTRFLHLDMFYKWFKPLPFNFPVLLHLHTNWNFKLKQVCIEIRQRQKVLFFSVILPSLKAYCYRKHGQIL